MNRVPLLLRRRLVLRAAVALAVVVVVVVVALAFRWWVRYVEDQLGRWAVGELARLTDGTYRLVLVDLFLVPMVVWDLASSGRVHPVTLGGGLALIVAQPLRMMLAEPLPGSPLPAGREPAPPLSSRSRHGPRLRVVTLVTPAP